MASKQLLPVYDKPMIYYPLTTLIAAGVTRILIISAPDDRPRYEALLGNGRGWGLDLSYAVQPEPRGIAQALLIGADFAGDGPVVLMLGDNLLHGPVPPLVDAGAPQGDGVAVLAVAVSDPRPYAVVTIDAAGRAVSLAEKPAEAQSCLAVPGLYVYGSGADAAARVRSLRPSARGEMEITDLNRTYLADGRLQVRRPGLDFVWFDLGTPRALLEAACFVRRVQDSSGLPVGCPEAAALRTGRIKQAGFWACLDAMPASSYRRCLVRLAEGIAQKPGRALLPPS